MGLRSLICLRVHEILRHVINLVIQVAVDLVYFYALLFVIVLVMSAVLIEMGRIDDNQTDLSFAGFLKAVDSAYGHANYGWGNT